MHGARRGPKTPEGIERIRKAHLKHGYYSKEAIEARRRGREAMKRLGWNWRGPYFRVAPDGFRHETQGRGGSSDPAIQANHAKENP